MDIQQRIFHKDDGRAKDLWYSQDDLDARYVYLGTWQGATENWQEEIADGTQGPVNVLVGNDVFFDPGEPFMGDWSVRQFPQTNRAVGGHETATWIDTPNKNDLVDNTNQQFLFMCWFKNRSWTSGTEQWVLDFSNQLQIYIQADGTLMISNTLLEGVANNTIRRGHWQPGQDRWFFLAFVYDLSTNPVTYKAMGGWQHETAIRELPLTQGAYFPSTGHHMSSNGDPWGMQWLAERNSSGSQEDNDDILNPFDGWIAAAVWKLGVVHSDAKLLSEFTNTRGGENEFDWDYGGPTFSKGGAWNFERPYPFPTYVAGTDNGPISSELSGPPESTRVRIDMRRHVQVATLYTDNPDGGTGDQFLIGPLESFTDDDENLLDVGTRSQIFTVANLRSATREDSSNDGIVAIARMAFGNNDTFFHNVVPGDVILKPWSRYPRVICFKIEPDSDDGGWGRSYLVTYGFEAGRPAFFDPAKPNYNEELDADPYV